MNLLPGLAWLVSKAMRRSPVAHHTPDPADMGTAFGLDASMTPDDAPDASVSTAKEHTSKDRLRSSSDRLVRRPRR